APHGGLLVIVFDESDSDNTHGGGNVPWIVVGPDVKRGYVSNTFYQHPSTLRFLSEALGLTTFPGTAATAPDMQEFISNSSPADSADLSQ
ncbi:alkaline phosphatase family protein, partial [Alloacidobacterium sp.]|uniref:alkaline phosphatase family protein n=1 Tax=Alloacidobacterium sp. TaxID=2951999 RepID=UPI002D73D052